MTVLYVEDDNQILKEVLEEPAYDITNLFESVITASNGEEGLNRFIQHQESVQLIITDIQMPKLNGLEMIKKIRMINPEIPVILTSKFSNPEYMEESINIGVDAYVTKPIDLKKFKSAIDKAILKIENNVYQKELEETNSILSLVYTTDKMTGIYNRKSFFAKALKVFKESKDKNTQLCVIVFSINSLENIDNTYSAEKGDEVIREFSKVMQNRLSSDTLYGRINGHEFSVMVPNINAKKASNEAEFIKKLAADIEIETQNNEKFHFDISYGIASLEAEDTLDTLFIRADEEKNRYQGDPAKHSVFRTRS
jgi:diguanylate cyclase (GGDEF)-like protein